MKESKSCADGLWQVVSSETTAALSAMRNLSPAGCHADRCRLEVAEMSR